MQFFRNFIHIKLKHLKTLKLKARKIKSLTEEEIPSGIFSQENSLCNINNNNKRLFDII